MLIAVGDEELSAIEDAAVFLYRLFLPSPEWCRSHGEAIRKALGPYPASVATRACNNVKMLLSYLPDLATVESSTKKSDKEEEMVKEFGHKIVFKFAPNMLSGDQLLAEGVSGDSLSEAEEDHERYNIGFITGSTSSPAVLLGDSRGGQEQAQPLAPGNTEMEKFGPQWLQMKCKECSLSGLTWQQLYAKVFDLLTAANTGNLQNDVRNSLMCVLDSVVWYSEVLSSCYSWWSYLGSLIWSSYKTFWSTRNSFWTTF